jgi:hypothetical protein
MFLFVRLLYVFIVNAIYVGFCSKHHEGIHERHAPASSSYRVRERSEILAARGAKFGKGRVSYRIYGGAPIRRHGDIDGDVQRWRLFDGGMKPNFCVPA